MAPGVCVLLSLCVCVCVCSGFNLDTHFPVLKSGGGEGSLFGLSVALHQDIHTGTYRLLVGAPRDRAEPNVPANRTGGVYSCPITAQQADCTRISLIDPEVQSDDMVEDMWLGVSVASQGPPGGRVLACGHRFVKLFGESNLRHMIGRCYLRGNDLPFNETDTQWQNPQQPCSHEGDLSDEVMCTSGISASITQTEVILGSPGSYEWQGNVHVFWMNPTDEYHTERNSFPNLEQRHIYKGYSVTQARRLLSQDAETIVTGAPRDNKNDSYGSVFLAGKQKGQLISHVTLRGNQTGSYYGNALATTDINNDGWNDLLVGAPFFFRRGQDVGGARQDVGGAVYVYMNTGGAFDSRASVVLTGPGGSAFGMSVAAAGDLDQDGFQDFAVGAPFHGTGSVMIWRGSSEGISTEPSQVILGRSVSPVFSSFGFSLSGAADADGNKYPDLLVGSLDGTVALLRTRPVLHLNKTLTVSPDVIDPDSCDYCIQVKVCFSYLFSTGEQSIKDNITVHFTVIADVTSLKPRLRFRDKQNVFSGFLSMPKKHCEVLEVGIMSPVRDKVEPLVFSLNASLHEKIHQKRNSSVVEMKRLPVLSQTPRPIRTQVHFQKACGSDNRCHSNLQLTARFTNENQEPFPWQTDRQTDRQTDSQLLHYDGSVRRLFLEANVSNTQDDAHNAMVTINIPPLLVYSGVRTKSDVQSMVECSVENGVLVCELGNPFRSNQEVQVLITFQLTELSLNTTEIRSVLQLSTLSDQSDLSPVSVSMLVEYSLQTSLYLMAPLSPASFSGHVIGESAMKKTEDVGSLLIFTLQVQIHGQPLGNLGNLAVQFDWPRESTNGKWLLYLEEIQLNGTSAHTCVPPGNLINPLRLQLSERQRERRSVEDQRETPAVPLHLHTQKKKAYTLDCGRGAQCVSFSCPLPDMQLSASLTVTARLWNSTMMEDYSDARSVLVRGLASLKLQTNKSTITMATQQTQIEVLILPDPEQPVAHSAPLWVILVSALTGAMLLGLLCLMLYKCGFFRRMRTRELYEAKTQKASIRTQPSDQLLED